ncbi:hypothetical protein HPB48_009050 [Haemaphysalis longicornis]|uniref:Uncharacterized protein n=1 Tax=Haemaphysalis longicornis TaxID=44386 RepID=A0A9J6FY63_HAELO|nr:hypothetical protein HPB48_009050 [Haemaphysalis longicornis]
MLRNANTHAPKGVQFGLTFETHAFDFSHQSRKTWATVDGYDNRQFRSERCDANNVKTGTYGYRDVNGLYRSGNYIADANGSE